MPIGFFSEKIAKTIGDYIGTFVRFDEKNYDGWWKSFLRIKVTIDISKPLLSKMRIRKIGSDWSWISFSLTEEKAYGAWLRAASRRGLLAAGRQWLVLDNDQ
nr:uncharacterized protein LOC109147766 [Ipomoea batatas]